MIPVGKQIQTSLRLISVSLSNVLYCIYDLSVVSLFTLYLNKILFSLNIFTDRSKAVLFCGSFVLFMSFVCHAFASVHCCLVVT